MRRRAAAALVLVLLGACSGGEGGSAPGTTVQTTPPGRLGAGVEAVDPGDLPTRAAPGGSDGEPAAFVAAPREGTVLRWALADLLADEARPRRASADLGRARSVAPWGGRVLVTAQDRAGLYVLDGDDLTLVAVVPFEIPEVDGRAPANAIVGGVTVEGRAAYVQFEAAGRPGIARVEVSTGRTRSVLLEGDSDVFADPCALAGAVFVPAVGEVLRLDARTLEVTGSVPTPFGAADTDCADGLVWVAGGSRPRAVVIHPGTLEVVGRKRWAGTGAAALDAGGGRVAVAEVSGRAVLCGEGACRRSAALGGEPAAVALAGAVVVAAVYQPGILAVVDVGDGTVVGRHSVGAFAQGLLVRP